MTYTKLKTIEKLNEYREMYLKAQDYKNDSISSINRIDKGSIFDFINMKDYRKERVLTYQKIQDRIEQRINNLINELKTQ
jgi:benzoyl-CoA reductase/2-hydroxyglutaryl-CoA dehydratase subunit BcrC/BadD/HgdB